MMGMNQQDKNHDALTNYRPGSFHIVVFGVTACSRDDVGRRHQAPAHKQHHVWEGSKAKKEFYQLLQR
jgi:hypothetical protein